MDARLASLVAAMAGVVLGCASSAPAGSQEAPPGSTVELPIFSADPCEQDQDCAPVAQCHPDRCARVEQAGTMLPDMMCTMECRPGTTDCGFNHCGCALSPAGAKVCALLPGPAGR